MSRYTHQVGVTEEQLRAAVRRAYIVAVVLWVGFFTIFVTLVPEAPKDDANPPWRPSSLLTAPVIPDT
jgi:hypothetical protein